jgi:isopentenyl diphosphate isomerase/L-lactate dehydrogenase-like FMN-dependent dehydrogenase
LLAQAKESGFTSLALTADLTWYGNREMDTRNGFTVPPSYSSSQVLQALKKPAWSWDFLANDEYAYAALDVAVRARQERAAACSLGNTSTRNHPEAEEPLPTDRRAQVSFIRDAFDPSFNWNDAEWLCDEWGSVGPVALKGVVRPDDASRAVASGTGLSQSPHSASLIAHTRLTFPFLQSGFDAVWVSNHGGRQLEGAVAPIDVLPSIRGAMGGTEAWCAAKNVADSVRKGGGGDAEIATAVAQRVPDMKTSLRTGLPVEIILDGGITRGTDIVKALVLGADAVGLGKPFLFGLCAGGETGVRKVFEILREETERAMGLLGAGSVQDLREANSGKREDEKFVRRRSTGRGRDFRV